MRGGGGKSVGLRSSGLKGFVSLRVGMLIGVRKKGCILVYTLPVLGEETVNLSQMALQSSMGVAKEEDRLAFGLAEQTVCRG